MKIAIAAVLLFVTSVVASAQQQPSDSCARTSGMRIYSNAAYIEEAGDVIGIELGLAVRPDNTVSALLYDYEGAPTGSGSPLTGRVTGDVLAIEGTLIQPATDSSGKEIVDRVPVKLLGTLDRNKFVGSIQWNGGSVQALRLHRVDAIWLCRANKKTANPPLR